MKDGLNVCLSLCCVELLLLLKKNVDLGNEKKKRVKEKKKITVNKLLFFSLFAQHRDNYNVRFKPSHAVRKFWLGLQLLRNY